QARRSPYGSMPVSLQWRNPSPGRSAQPVAELDLAGSSTFRRSQVEPTDESPGRLLYRGPEAVPCEALVVVEERRQNHILDPVARRRPAPIDEAHHVRIAVELDEVVDVVLGELSQQQALGFQKDLHGRMRNGERRAIGVATPGRPLVCSVRSWVSL